MVMRASTFLLLGLTWPSLALVYGFAPALKLTTTCEKSSLFAAAEEDDSTVTAPTAPPPMLNGKRVLPYSIVMTGLKGFDRKVAGVYVVLDSSYARGTEGWNRVSFVGVAHDLATTLATLQEKDATEMKVAHVRALSFSFPQPNAMQEVASQWREKAIEAGSVLEEQWGNDVLDYLYEDEDDDDDDMAMVAQAMDAVSGDIVSPFESDADLKVSDSTETLELNEANVDKVLDEVRPYLIADGGNVSIERVDAESMTVVLKLEGACGSCSSSTVTMQMGIERVLKEKWPGVDVSKVEDDEESQPKSLSYEAVAAEVNRLKPALIAMGCKVDIAAVEEETGRVEITFTGSDKVRQGLELALQDVPFVETIEFTEP